MTTLSDISALVQAYPNPVLLIGRDERVVAANGAAEVVIGPDLGGRHYISALRQPDVLDAIEGAFLDGEMHGTRYLGQAGQRDTTWKVTAAPVRLSAGRAVLLSFEDITAVEEAGQMRRDFVANVSHEMRTPLTALLGMVETLRGPAKDDEGARDRFLGIMEREAGRMSHLVDDLLSLSRVEENERLKPVDEVNLSALVSEVVEVLQPVAAQAGLALRLTTPDAPVLVAGDEGQLRQVLNNLLENAIKYGTGGESVDVGLSGPDHDASLRTVDVRLSVRDHGEGIASHHIARLTERFYRIDAHRSREVGGTGLGLAIVKHIVNRHRGRLRIESELGEGSRFSVVLPVE